MTWLKNTIYQPFQQYYKSFLENDCIKLAGSLNSLRLILLGTYRVNRRNQGKGAAGTAVCLFAAGCKVVVDKLWQVAVVLCL